MAEPTSALADGLRGTYVLDRAIGEGGMATVFLAQDIKHQRPVALKVLKPELAQSLGPERFRREITTAARLQHPHILSVFDSGETAGQLWFTMPYVEGETLRELLKRERCLPVDEALRITRETAQALQYAHERGIVHRDIKPENILLTPDGSTLVADFGIARAVGTGVDEVTGENLTQTGAAIGTPTYMAPEQATGQGEVDARVDQYALAVTLFEMFTGEPPFTASTSAALIAKRFTSDVPSARTRRPEVPPNVDVALRKALSLQAGERFGSMVEFSRALGMASSMSTPAVSPTVAMPADGARASTRRPSLIPIAVGLLLLAAAGGVLLSRRGAQSAGAIPAASSTPRVAVLPFENLGDSASAYFADGMTDEVRGKLAQLSGLAVIARSSSNEYRGTAKPPQEIARELGANFLLTATVRWERRPDSTSRVRVSTELVEIAAGGAPTTKWQQTFDAPLTDVFQVQGDIAGKVASALDLALGAGQQQALAERPTENLAAYDAFLKGEAAWGANSQVSPEQIQQGIRNYKEAVRLDTSFALAWAQLGRAQAAAYYNITPTPEYAEGARIAAQRAVALAPGRPESQLALGDYFTNIHDDNDRALVAYQQGLEVAPGDAELLSSAALSEWSLSRWEAAQQHLEKSQVLDPRSLNNLRRLLTTYLRQRRYREAQSVAERGLALAPTSINLIEGAAMIRIGQGDLDGARGILREGMQRADSVSLAAFVSNYWDLFWALDEAGQQVALRTTPSAYGDDPATWALVQTQLRQLRGDHAGSLAYAEKARTGLELQLKQSPGNAGRMTALGLALAYLGRSREAIEWGERGLAKLPVAKDGYVGPYLQHQLVRIYLMAGDKEKALDLLEPLLKMPYYLSPGWLKVDPTFDPLRGNPRFERLVRGG